MLKSDQPWCDQEFNQSLQATGAFDFLFDEVLKDIQ